MSELAWRRRWKSNIEAEPWQPLQIDGNEFLIKTHFERENYKILISDFVDLWHEEADKDAVVKRSKVIEWFLIVFSIER